ncbi:hypothetical protein HYFRA_00005771 [Hymenoscyphus fraxineus]|uniref:ubiquitinyl hydrolase 1 n=1 Tax=Hymenoscyphus fraxineus TaxID=746836 RepID=A0A9N9KY70_9HELO|nr:hypothetical protein HYFRA_00005771 [Hymenoscyphus fraxineus]
MTRYNIISSKPGKTAPRLIEDLLDYDPRYLERQGGHLLADPPPQWKGDGHAIFRKDENDCRHKLMLLSSRSNTPKSASEDADPTTKWVVATYCDECLWHFDITVDYTSWKNGHTPCKMNDQEHPLHHLQHVESMYSKKDLDQENSITEIHQFACSQLSCPVEVKVEISKPRLRMELLAPLLDSVKVRARGEREIRQDPERFEGTSPANPFQALGYLKTYIQHAIDGDPSVARKRINKRNKKFALCFDAECDELFNYLGFTTTQEDDTNGVRNFFWQQPIVTEQNKPFFEDVMFEIIKQMSRRPAHERGPTEFKIPLKPALESIQQSLGFSGYPRVSRTILIDSSEEHPHYRSLGAIYDFTDDYLSWAYDRQRDCDPLNAPYYLDCVSAIANGRKSSDLQTKVVMAISNGEFGLEAIQQAYRFFNVDPDNKEGDDYIIGLYKSRIESAPRQKEEARNSLLAIGKARDSEKIRAVANDKAMTVTEALDFFQIASNLDSDSIEAVAVSLSMDGDASKVARALRVIANDRNDPTLQRAATNMEAGNPGSTLSVTDAYNRLQMTTVQSHSANDETVLNYYQSLMSDAGPGSQDSFTEALRVIAIDRGSNFLLTKLDDPNAVVEAAPSTSDQPVGLDNIGNTCYLNSLLQYYYTVTPVRKVVIDFQNHRMSLNEEDIKKKRVGGRIVAKSEIIKAQKFVDELHSLFENLRTASTHSVKPTRELAELTIFSSAAEANFRRVSISSPNGPPNLASLLDSPVYGPQLPPDHPIQLPPIQVEDDIEMVDHPGDKSLDNDDDSSEATLVDMVDPPSYEASTSKDQRNSPKDIIVHDGIVDNDTVMVNGTDAPSEEKSLPKPEKQPPLPPRNKSGLVIQTNDQKEKVSDDELWRFGSQQDVTEVIGNVNFRLLCALKPTSIDAQSGEQMDIVRDTLYGANAVYLQKAQTLEKKVEAWSNLIVFPAPNGPRDIYEALDVVFDEQIVEIDNSTAAQHASIDKLPPILHIQIQRTAFDSVRQVASKNRNAVNFPETIYLDRYMDSPNPESTLMKRRRETWKWKAQLKVLEARQAALNKTVADISVADALIATKEYINKLQEEEIDGVLVGEDLSECLEERTAEVAEELESISREIAALKQNLNEQFTDMRQYEYKLQAVFIHRGEAGGGHYWIYIYDFDNDIWREYNDEYVTEVKDRRRIFEHQGAVGGTPYYLAYVRSSDRADLVQAVCREVDPPASDPMDVSQGIQFEEAYQNATAMEEDDEGGETRHVEHVKPRPIRPKPVLGVPKWEAVNDQTPKDAHGRPWQVDGS